MRPLHEQRVLLLHPFLNFYGGAEYLLSVVAKEIFPNASIMTFSNNDAVLRQMGISSNRVVPLLGKGIGSRLYKQITPLYPSLVDTTGLGEFDIVLSFSYAYVHGFVTSHNQLHISHIQTPMRLLWLKESEHYVYDKIPLIREVYRSILAWQRVWDKQASTRPDYLLANSREVSNRISTFWGRPSDIVYPPVDTDFYLPTEPVRKEEYYITHSRLVRYKRIDILIDACIAQKKKLVVVGDGPEYKKLVNYAKNSPDIVFTGYLSHTQKRELLQKANGFLFAAHEDFGIVPIEALAAGTPVLAFGRGGALETVTPDTGMFFKQQTADSISSQLPLFEKFVTQVNREVLKHQAEKFSKQSFIKNYTRQISEKAKDFEKNGPPVV
ncbi:glycosyltransferase [bacterium]|nr:glycosyltransferase [bacterium]